MSQHRQTAHAVPTGDAGDDSAIDVIESLRRRAHEHPGGRALIVPDRADGHSELGHADLRRSCELVALALRRRGVRRGDRVAVHLTNRAEAVFVYLAAVRLGAVIVPLDVRYSPDDVRNLIARTRPAAYIGEAAHYDRVANVPVDLLAARSRVVIGPDRPVGTNGWDEFVAGIGADGSSSGAALYTVPDTETTAARDDPAFLLATSGTSGRRKLAIWSYRTLAHLWHSAGGRGITPGAVVPVLTPLTHAAGVYFTFASLAVGATPVLLPSGADSGSVLDAMRRHGATTVFGMPFLLAGLAREQRARPREIVSLRGATVSGDVCPPGIVTAFAEVFGVALRAFWAATEDVGATVTSGEPGPCCRAAPGTRIRVVDPDGRCVPPGGTGELLTCSPTTVPGYWDDVPEADTLTSGWFRTGDLVMSRGGGHVRYVGRVKDLIVRGGSKIAPVVVEEVLRSHPDVLDAGVAGYPDDELGQRVGAVVVLRGVPRDRAVEEILRWSRTRLADHELPERVLVVAAVPRTAMTKVDRARIASILTAGA